jgi:hypothetical protein
MRALSLLVGFATLLSQSIPAWAVDYNLGSTQASEVAPSTLTAPVPINVGGKVQMVSPGGALTPAQAAALQQVLAGGSQSLVLGHLGNAVGGHAVVPAGSQFSSMTVPRNVTVIADFSANALLNLSGNLVNSGALYAASTNASINSATLMATNINNNLNGIISSVVPAGGLPGFANAIPDLGLSLIARNRLFNAGTISSAADLAIATPTLVNSGTLQAANNLNVGGPGIANLNVVNTGGMMTADIDRYGRC